jgi:hypothetical protein
MKRTDVVKERGSLEDTLQNGKGRCVLLVNPAKQDNFCIERIHMGLILLEEFSRCPAL